MSLFSFFRRRRSDAELQDEIECFLAEETAENESRGMSSDEARRQARIKLGSPQKVRESLWVQNSPVLLTNVGRDLQYAFRTLSRTPGFSIIAVAVMALCIGAATSLFTIVRSILLRPLPFRDPGRLVMPVGGTAEQELRVVTKHDGQIETSVATYCRFVPLRGGKDRR